MEVEYKADSDKMFVLTVTKGNFQWKMLFAHEQVCKNEAHQFMLMGWSCTMTAVTTEFLIDVIDALNNGFSLKYS